MSLFDTLILEPAVVCSNCGKIHDQTQTHLLGDSMSTWRIGSLIRFCPIHTGIMQEEVFCCPIPGTEHEHNRISIWIVVWHGIYAGHALDENTAIHKMNGIDRLDLLTWLDMAQTEMRTWRGRYRSIRRDLINLQEAKSRAKEEESEPGKHRFGFFNFLPEEIINDPDPLARILERNAENLEPSGMWLDD